jgi:hypothetical protein
MIIKNKGYQFMVTKGEKKNSAEIRSYHKAEKKVKKELPEKELLVADKKVRKLKKDKKG